MRGEASEIIAKSAHEADARHVWQLRAVGARTWGDEVTAIPSDIRITPPWIVAVAKEFAVPRTLHDVCTESDNPIGADSWWSWHEGVGVDALCASWTGDGGTNWCNPPWSRGAVATWAAKAAREARHGAEILLLTLADVRTGWHAQLAENADARCQISRSVGFLEPTTVDGVRSYKQLPGHTMGCTVWYWGRRRRRFARVFGEIGEIIHGLGPREVAIEGRRP